MATMCVSNITLTDATSLHVEYVQQFMQMLPFGVIIQIAW